MCVAWEYQNYAVLIYYDDNTMESAFSVALFVHCIYKNIIFLCVFYVLLS